MNAKDLMTTPAITVGPEMSIRAVAAVMRKNRISGVPVVDQSGALLGVVTELNLIMRNAPIIGPNYLSVLSGLIPIELGKYHHYREQLRQVLATTAGELMTEDVKYITPHAELETIMGLMEKPEVTLLPVVEQGTVIGVVTRTDLVRLIEKLEMTSDEASSEASDETSDETADEALAEGPETSPGESHDFTQ